MRMSKEEAIAHGKEQLEVFGGEHAEFIKLAIQALEQECEDAISREAVLDKAWDVPYDGKYIQVVDVGDIKELPPVTPTRKKGHWIFVDKAHEHAHCSECGYGNVDLFNGRPHNFCPNCGAKMEK